LFEDIGIYKDRQQDFLYFCKPFKTGDDWF